mmetsp:Transcript_30579/g.29488  ORF Transcript_30579/g.29488 Transcript_30579/m.29488 type:complete len:293 (-) Transcript_30579:223-1101(-)|eukprot:CAMPEP_0197826674 /NCGR_PEP_ID=MMETSP1437-20131217/3596_1 /TAXON_ID=49252 ORGANISM="Eucampia antarctica, Strain CCMP1452" /NCGR_SAMPLE_ID=MMETSP1437 /ASSEMBLY_ACC=CAM_ASM_001096 /LENGTH=292 /DNA_ID=CAMNT_0043427203 /DNA_START=44 /DNA_END=922 /DNA_ORIENTATION=-
MTTAALTFGCGLIAFSPSMTMLLFLVYSKAQLVIVVTSAAFAYLLSSLLSSLIWLPFPASMKDGNAIIQPLILIPVAVLCQALLRCGFVSLYIRVEGVIERSICQHESEHQHQQGNDGSSEISKLKLELNDWACGLAAGTGFGGMHVIMLYGTLLASESGSMGTLYQPSCNALPSLVNSALMAFFFAILDFILMFLTFYGMRRRNDDAQQQHQHNGYLGISKGSSVIAVSMLLHLATSIATTANRNDNGCTISLPIVAGIVLLSTLFFVQRIVPDYLPKSQRDRIDDMRHLT